MQVEHVANVPVGAWLTYSIASPAKPFVSYPQAVMLTDTRGRAEAFAEQSDQCGEGPDHGSTCSITLTFGSQARARRLALSIRETGSFPPFGGTSIGPWHASFAMP
jgi:hypothetical protein